MELLSGYSDAGINAFNANQNMIGNNLMNSINNQMAQQQIDMARWNAESLAMAQPTPYGYGFVPIYQQFSQLQSPGYYSPGSGRSSFSGVALPGGGGSYNDSAGLSPSTAPNGGRNPFTPGSGSAQRWDAQYGHGGIGSDAARAPDDISWGPPTIPLSAGGGGNPYPLGDSSWYPTERQPAQDLSAWYAGLPGGAQAYNSWNLGLPAQGGFGVPGAGGGRNPFTPGSGSAQRWDAQYNGRSLPGDIGFTPQSPMPNIGYNPGMQNSFANPAMNSNPFQNRFGMGFPNAGTPNQYAPGAQMPPGFREIYGVDNPEGALPLGPGVYQNSPFGEQLPGG